jgi:uncharacterized protein
MKIYICVHDRTFRWLMIFLYLLFCLHEFVNAEVSKPNSTEFGDEIILDTPSGIIYGSLAWPQNRATAPLVLIIAGSGPTDRNGNSSGIKGTNDGLLLLARSLADLGIASVRYDKRGVKQSQDAGSDESTLRFESYVDDAVAWLRKLSLDKRFTKLIVLGHSEGALIAMRAIASAPSDAIICVSSPALRASDILRLQLKHKLSSELLLRNEEILRELEAGHKIFAVPKELESLYRPPVQSYLISWFRYNPKTEIAKIKIPILMIYGQADTQIDFEQAKLLHDASKNAELLIIKGMNHILKLTGQDVDTQKRSFFDPTISIPTELPLAIQHFIFDSIHKN